MNLNFSYVGLSTRLCLSSLRLELAKVSTLKRPKVRDLILWWASYLYAFSTYPLRTQLLGVYAWQHNRYTVGPPFPVLSY